MADNYLITGYWGTPHVTAENDRGIHAGIFGTGRFVLATGEQFEAQYIGSNTIRLSDGKLIDNGAAAGIPAGNYIDFLVPNASQGAVRNDIIIFEYTKNPSSGVESGVFKRIEGAEATGTATDPQLSQNDLLSGNAVLDQMALWRIPVSEVNVGTPEKLFEVRTLVSADGTSVPITKGGTGATTAEAALAALHGIPKTKPVTATGTNLNSYTATGIYFFSESVTPTNIPGGTNGWLVVLNATQSDTSTAYVKQIFIRAGTPGSNDFYIWARTKANGGGWGSWCKLLMNTLVSGEYGTSLPAAGSPGRIFFRKVGS